MIDAPLVSEELALLWMVNMACIDMNTWYSRVDKPERPDWVLFDLDPSPDVGFAEVVEVAKLVKSVLDELGLAGYAKTSGADGMHVLVPIARRSTYAQARELGEIVARTLASTHRGLVTTEWVKREASRRPHRRQPERRGKDDRVGLLGAAPAGSARLDAAALERGEGRARPDRLHDGRRAAARGEGRRPVSGVLEGGHPWRRRSRLFASEFECECVIDVARPCLVDGRVATLRRKLTNVDAELLLELR